MFLTRLLVFMTSHTDRCSGAKAEQDAKTSQESQRLFSVSIPSSATDGVTAQKPPKPLKPGSDVVSLFEARRIKGFLPVYNDATGENVLTVHAVMTFFQFSRRFKYFFFFSAG